MKLTSQIPFATSEKKDWATIAQKELKGKDPSDALQWKNMSGFHLEAYYDHTDTERLQYLIDFFKDLPGHRWKLYQQITLSDKQDANKEALEALMGGCDGIIFDKRPTDEEQLLKGINQDICDIIYLDSPDISTHETVSNQDPVDQITYLITHSQSKSLLKRTALPDFFLEIASVRALRYLLAGVSVSDILIHTSMPEHAQEDHQWFLNTTAGLASILGGSHSVDFYTAVGDSRISRNTGHIIREESKITHYRDQCGGSYYIEVLTDMLIRAVSQKMKL